MPCSPLGRIVEGVQLRKNRSAGPRGWPASRHTGENRHQGEEPRRADPRRRGPYLPPGASNPRILLRRLAYHVTRKLSCIPWRLPAAAGTPYLLLNVGIGSVVALVRGLIAFPEDEAIEPIAPLGASIALLVQIRKQSVQRPPLEAVVLRSFLSECP